MTELIKEGGKERGGGVNEIRSLMFITYEWILDK